MSDLEIWLTIIFLTLATFITRSGFWLVGDKVNLPDWVQQALRYAPACALAAIIFPEILLNGAHFNTSLENPKLWAAILASAFFLVRKNMLQTIFFGMAVFTYLRLGM